MRDLPKREHREQSLPIQSQDASGEPSIQRHDPLADTAHDSNAAVDSCLVQTAGHHFRDFRRVSAPLRRMFMWRSERHACVDSLALRPQIDLCIHTYWKKDGLRLTGNRYIDLQI
jgi:hypothetical protein